MRFLLFGELKQIIPDKNILTEKYWQIYDKIVYVEFYTIWQITIKNDFKCQIGIIWEYFL